MSLYTPEQIEQEVLRDKEEILNATYPEDYASEYADNAVPIYYSDIIQEWNELPEEYSNQFREIRDTLPDRVEDLMRDDLYLYYSAHYSNAITELLEKEGLR